MLSLLWTGISLRFTIGYEDIQCSVFISDEIKANIDFAGLYGNMDGDPSNDLMAANGTILSPDASEDSIFENFGKSCKSMNQLLVLNFQRNTSLFNQSINKILWHH